MSASRIAPFSPSVTSCRVELVHTARPGGAISVLDNGAGMTEEDLKQGFLVVGKSRKASADLTRRFGRVPVG